jgi:hypothetical protein
MKRWQIGVMAVSFLAVWRSGALAQQARGPDIEVIEIDGRKNPELIPQWSAWGYAFRVIASGSRLLPSDVLSQSTSAEQALIVKQADAVQGFDRECLARHQKILTDRGDKKPEVLDKEVRELTLDCRRNTLHARDRLLAGLSPAAQAALIAFVESTKRGTSLSIPKKDLPRFLEPE